MFYKFFRFCKFYRVQFRKTCTAFVVMVVMYGNTQALSMFSLFDIWCSRPCITTLYLSQIPSLAYDNWVLLMLKVTSLLFRPLLLQGPLCRASRCARRCDPPRQYLCCECIDPCFPSTARASLENGRSVTMAELQIGDKVQTGKDITNVLLTNAIKCEQIRREYFI